MKRALFIGVDKYQDDQIRNLNYAYEDANALGEIFRELGYETEVLRDPDDQTVKKSVHSATAGLGPKDQFLFYFSGHGFADAGRDLLFCTDHRYCNLVHLCAGIPFSLLEDHTRRGGYERVFILDACRSDFLTGVRGGAHRNLGKIGDMVPTEEVAPGAFYVLRSCEPRQFAYEIDEQGHGLFTLAFINVLKRFRDQNSYLSFNDKLRLEVSCQMRNIVQALKKPMSCYQTPESCGRGNFIHCLVEGERREDRLSDIVLTQPEPVNAGPERAEPLNIFNAFAGLLMTKELQPYLDEFQHYVTFDPNELNPRRADARRIIANSEELIKLFRRIRDLHLNKSRDGKKLFYSEAYRLNLSLTLEREVNRNRFLEAMYECVELRYIRN